MLQDKNRLLATGLLEDSSSEKIFLAILAGGKTDAETLHNTGQALKALLPYQNKPLIEIAIDAALKTKSNFIGLNLEIEVYGDNEVLRNSLRLGLDEGVKIIDTADKNTLFDVFERVIDDKPDDALIVFVASDLPFLSEESLSSIIRETRYKNGIYYPVISEEYVPCYLRSLKTFRKLSGVCYTGGNVVAGRARCLKSAAQYTRGLIASRKNPLKMAYLFGPMILFGFAVGLWRPSQIAEKISKKTGIKIRPFCTDDWRMAVDIDSWSDYQALSAPHP